MAPTERSSGERRPTDAATRRGRAGSRKADVVRDELGLQIVAGRLAPGQRLQTEAELGLRFGVSRASLREGLKALAGKGLVETRTRGGTRVRARTQWDLLDADILQWMAAAPPDPEFVAALLEVRAIIEPAAAHLAAQRAGAAAIDGIEGAYNDMAASLPHDVEACCRHDLEFHERIIAAAGNILLSRLAAAIRTTLLAAFRISANARRSYEASLKEHWAVVAAIRRGEPAEAERMMRRLLAGTARDLAPAFPGGLPAKPRAPRQAPRKPRRTGKNPGAKRTRK
ncbi:MAG: FadR family transcriptional regulator [Alphaproteobacteria bacterium]|nr:FadR family transcriptional regulator [Alphaproteobacteria bacterium]